MLIAVNYHYIRERFNEPYPSIFGVTPIEFAEQLDVLGTEATFVGASDVLEAIDGGGRLPERAAMITFDDGLAEQFELAWPILKAKGIPALFFVNTKPIEEHSITATHKIHIVRAYASTRDILETIQRFFDEQSLALSLPDASEACSVYRYDEPEAAQLKYFLNYRLDEQLKDDVLNACLADLGFDERELSRKLYMSRAQLQILADNDSLGAHGHTHRALGLMSDQEARDDVELSICKLREWTGITVPALSYPFGFQDACSQAAATAAQDLGIRFAFTMERAANTDLQSPMFLARFSNNDAVPNGGSSVSGRIWNDIEIRSWFRA